MRRIALLLVIAAVFGARPAADQWPAPHTKEAFSNEADGVAYAWHNMGFGRVIASYSPDGHVLASYQLTDLFSSDEIGYQEPRPRQ